MNVSPDSFARCLQYLDILRFVSVNDSRWVAALYTVGVFFMIPLIFLGLTFAGRGGVVAGITVLLFILCKLLLSFKLVVL
jgi:hypothetical protein